MVFNVSKSKLPDNVSVFLKCDKLIVYFADDGQISINQIVDNIDVITQHSIDGDQLVTAFHLLDRKDAGYLRYAWYVRHLVY